MAKDYDLPYGDPPSAFVPDPHRRQNHIYRAKSDETFHVLAEQYGAVFAAHPIRDTAPTPTAEERSPEEAALMRRTVDELMKQAQEKGITFEGDEKPTKAEIVARLMAAP